MRRFEQLWGRLWQPTRRRPLPEQEQDLRCPRCGARITAFYPRMIVRRRGWYYPDHTVTCPNCKWRGDERLLSRFDEDSAN
jgi:hypothetical protein